MRQARRHFVEPVVADRGALLHAGLEHHVAHFERWLSHRYGIWLRLFGGDPAILGRTVVFEVRLGAGRAIPYQVVGVMPPEFRFPAAQTAFWMLPRATQSLPFRGRLPVAVCWPGSRPDGRWPARPVRRARPRAREHDELVATVRPAVLVLAAAVTGRGPHGGGAGVAHRPRSRHSVT